jgi:glucose/arabinose dehydrogenase
VVRRRFALSVPLILGLVLTAALPAPALAAAPTLRNVVVQDGLLYPWDVAFAPGGQMFVTERAGRIKVFASGGKDANLLASNPISHMRAEGEAGAMGLALDPSFGSNRLLYVCASRNYNGNWLNQVLRYRVRANWTLEFDRYVIRLGMRANTIHNGCAVEFGPDGMLWVTMGDANNPALAQNPTSLNGKVLRMNRNGSVPSTNPIMPGTSTRTIVYSMGHRNPQGIAFHPVSDRVYAIEHGPNRSDEINWIRKASGGVGRNYGWPCYTGNNSVYSWISACNGNGPFTKSVWHSGSTTIATSGGAFVNGSAWDSFRKHLFVAQLKERDLRRFSIDSDGSPARYRATYFNQKWGRLRAVVLGPGNKLYLTTSNGSNDRVIRIRAVPAS